MIENTFYHHSTRRYTIAFGSIFNGISIDKKDSSGNEYSLPVPLQYSTKEKFIQRMNQISSITEGVPKAKETLPAMGFELLNMIYSPTRKTNTISRITDKTGSSSMFNRVPYDFNFVLYIAGRTIDETLRIVEQIAPYFTPELNIRIQDMDILNESTDVPVILEDIAPEITSDGDFEERRIVQWQLTFTMKGYLYAAQRDINTIKRTIVEINDLDSHEFLEGYIAEVNPFDANKDDDYTITETITSTKYVAANAYHGTEAESTME